MAERLPNFARTQRSWVRVLERGIILHGWPHIRFAETFNSCFLPQIFFPDKELIIFFSDNKFILSKEKFLNSNIYTMTLKDHLANKSLLTKDIEEAIDEYYLLRKQKKPIDSNYIFTFGKYKNRSFSEVLSNDKSCKSYFRWLIDKSDMFKDSRNAELKEMLLQSVS
jgi:hypothetical protein